MIYRKISLSDYELVAKLHEHAFKNFFLTTLGFSFLKTYYKACLKSENCISVCAVNDHGDIVGFAFGTRQSRGFHKQVILENIFVFSLQALRILFVKPLSILRLAKNLDKIKNPEDNGLYVELLSIGVDKMHSGLGIGKDLIANFENAAKELECTRIALTTDFYNNNDVISFYHNRGYEIYYELKAFPNRKMYKMIKTIKK